MCIRDSHHRHHHNQYRQQQQQQQLEKTTATSGDVDADSVDEDGEARRLFDRGCPVILCQHLTRDWIQPSVGFRISSFVLYILQTTLLWKLSSTLFVAVYTVFLFCRSINLSPDWGPKPQDFPLATPMVAYKQICSPRFLSHFFSLPFAKHDHELSWRVEMKKNERKIPGVIKYTWF